MLYESQSRIFCFQFQFLLNHLLIPVSPNISGGLFSIKALSSCSNTLMFAMLLTVSNDFTQNPSKVAHLSVKQWPHRERETALTQVDLDLRLQAKLCDNITSCYLPNFPLSHYTYVY